ncbi:YheC/YheD family protein [Neobacillus drentensis]|uniref:YheC/YheD family protein n=1 Tax=Neobacillus drentensis TaxID=220684 RepID=UPI002FFE3CD3
MSYSYGKWTKYHMMMENMTLVDYLPKTQLFSETAFWKLLNEYGMVVVKPSEGKQGYGVVQVSKCGVNQYEIHYKKNKMILDSCLLHEFLDKILQKNKLHIVQQKISLATIEGNPFDIRVMVQRKKDAIEWEVTGKVAKVAEDGYFITNVVKELQTIEQAYEQSDIKGIDFAELTIEMDNISLVTAYELQEFYPDSKVFGLDLGITADGRLFIIEANLSPSIGMFKKVNDKTIYQRIKEFMEG